MTDAPAPAVWSLFGRRHAVIAHGVPADLVARLLAGAGRGHYRQVEATRQVSLASLSHDDVRAATRRLSALAAACHLGSPFRPTEASYHRLSARHRGPPRRENRYYAECVALVVLHGAGELTVHDERTRDRVVETAALGPRDVVLLRGWSPLGFADPRPYHRITVTDGPLTLFRARHNLAAGTAPQAWLQDLTSREVCEATARAALDAV